MTVEAPERQKTGRRTVFPMHRLNLEEQQADGRRRIQGYAAVFGNRDAYGDIILPGAFARTLREKPDVKVLWQHNPREPIGKQETGVEDEFGLGVTGVLSNVDLVTGTVVPLLQDEVITGLSIGYDVVVEEYNAEAEAWFLKDIDLWEWSPVTFPANELASVTEVKELDTRAAGNLARVERHAKALEHLLGDGGYFDGESDRAAGLDSDLLAKLHATIGGKLPGAGQVTSADEEALEAAYLQGANDALDGTLAKQLKPED